MTKMHINNLVRDIEALALAHERRAADIRVWASAQRADHELLEGAALLKRGAERAKFLVKEAQEPVGKQIVMDLVEHASFLRTEALRVALGES